MIGTAWRRLANPSGFTLVELMVALALLTLGVVGVSMYFPQALASIESGKQLTTATFLAEQRLEQIKGTPFASVIAANFPAENYGAIPREPLYRRTVTITDNPGGQPDTKLVQVSVFFRPVVVTGVLGAERQVMLQTLIASR